MFLKPNYTTLFEFNATFEVQSADTSTEIGMKNSNFHKNSIEEFNSQEKDKKNGASTHFQQIFR